MGTQLKTDIYALAFGGRGIGKVDGKVCFVDGALPGEEVTFDLTKNTTRYIEGTVVDIVTPSADRTEPLCRYYSLCGGCQLQHMSYDMELSSKKEQLIQLVKRIAGNNDIECEDIVASPDCYHYRCSVTLHDKGGKYGYYRKNSRDIVEITECRVAEEAINRELAVISADVKGDITLKSDRSGRVWSSERTGERFYVEKYGDMNIFMSPKAFSQANHYISEKIVSTLGEWIGPSSDCGDTAFFDAYCGVGFFSFLLKQNFYLKVGIDTSRVAIDCAKNTIKNMDTGNARFYRMDVEDGFFKLFDKMKRKKNILFLDPPRKGVPGEFLEKIRTYHDLTGLYYLSCDPARLARDIKILTDEGSVWRMGRIQPFDMFPRTGHIETLVEFTRR